MLSFHNGQNCLITILTLLWSANFVLSESIHIEEQQQHFTLSLNNWTQLHFIGTRRNYTLNIDNIPSTVAYLIIQAHSFRHPVTLANAQNASFGEYVTSTDVGMTTLLAPEQEAVTWYLSTAAEKNVTVYVLVTPHDQFDPVPGACNQEFPLEYDPNIHLSHDPNIGSMAYQYGNRGFPRVMDRSEEPDCESQWDILRYDIYIHYMSSTNPSAPEHFLAMQHMTHPEDIVRYGRRMVSVERGQGQKPLSTFMAYPGQGIIYNVVVTQKEGRLVRRSSYIPSTSYSCNLAPDTPDSCDTLDDRSHPFKAIATLIACGGVLLMLFGHRFFKCNMFSFGFISCSLLSYIGMRLTDNMDPMNIFWIALAIGAVGGVLWLSFWWVVGVPILSVLLVGLTGGYLMASVVFYTPLDDVFIFRLEFNYGMIFACWVMFFNVIALPWTKQLSVLASSLIGSYSVVFAVGLYIKSSVPYLFINSVRKAVIPHFIQAIPTKPFFNEDGILLITWVVVFLCAAYFQFYITRRDPDFPPCPRTERRNDQSRLLLAEESANTDDRTGLLSQVDYPSYQTMDAAEAGRVNPDNGRASPAGFGTSGPLYGRASPSYGTSGPMYGRASPSYGTSGPMYGRASPSYGTSGPMYGRDSPRHNKSSPGYGTISGQPYGRASPGYATSSPGYGTSSTGYGTASPNQGSPAEPPTAPPIVPPAVPPIVPPAVTPARGAVSTNEIA